MGEVLVVILIIVGDNNSGSNEGNKSNEGNNSNSENNNNGKKTT